MSEQLDMDFSGKTYSPSRDRKRLESHFDRIQDLMSDHQWYTLKQLSEITRGSESCCSARYRDLKNKLGWVTEKRNLGGGLWEMRVVSFGVKQ